MLKLVKWFIGYVTFRFSGGFGEGFVNDCFLKGYNIQKIRREGDVLYAECPAALYQYLRPVAKANGGRLRVVKRKGLVFRMYPLRGRWGLYAGVVVCVALISFLSGFVWNIEVVGTETLSEKQVLSFLEENGLYKGVYFKSVDKDQIENLMLASFDECAWVHINRSGTTARVELSEAVQKPELTDSEGAANLKAVKDGVIVKATVYDGWQAVKVGEGVTKGDILISGVYESEAAESNMFAHARGEYIAQVEEPFRLTVSRTQEYKAYGDERIYKSLEFFGLSIPLYIGGSTVPDSDVTETYDYVTLNGETLPIGLKTKSVISYTIETQKLSDSELTSLTEEEIKKRLESDFKDAEIVKQKIDISLTSSSAEAKGTIICYENIGEEVMLGN